MDLLWGSPTRCSGQGMPRPCPRMLEPPRGTGFSRWQPWTPPSTGSVDARGVCSQTRAPKIRIVAWGRLRRGRRCWRSTRAGGRLSPMPCRKRAARGPSPDPRSRPTKRSPFARPAIAMLLRTTCFISSGPCATRGNGLLVNAGVKPRQDSRRFAHGPGGTITRPRRAEAKAVDPAAIGPAAKLSGLSHDHAAATHAPPRAVRAATTPNLSPLAVGGMGFIEASGLAA